MRQPIKNIFAKPEYFLLWFMVSIYPLLVIPGPFNYFTGPKYIVLAIISLSAFYLLVLRGKFKWHPVFMPLGIFVLLSIISTTLAGDFLKALVGNFHRFTGLSTYLFCVTLFFLAVQCKATDTILKYVIISASLVSTIGILQYFGFNIVPIESFRDLSQLGAIATIGNPNRLGSYMVFILPAAILSYDIIGKRAWLVFIAVIYCGLLVSLTRFAWLTFFVSFALIAIYLMRLPGKRKLLINVILTLAVITMIMLPTKDGIIVERAMSISDEVTAAAHLESHAGSGRLHLWSESIKVISQNWPFGVGFDHLEFETPVFADKAHNIYLDMGATAGIFALLSYLVFLSYFLRPWKDERGFLFFMMIFTYLLQGFFIFDYIMVMPIFWIVLGLSLSHQDVVKNKHLGIVHGDEGRDVPQRSRILRLIVFAIVAGLIMLYLGFAAMLWLFQ